MPPASQSPIDTSYALPVAVSKPIGPTVGVFIVVILLIVGGLYFWGARLNKENEMRNQIPYIPSGTTTITIQQ
jgi:hypothetical protein